MNEAIYEADGTKNRVHVVTLSFLIRCDMCHTVAGEGLNYTIGAREFCICDTCNARVQGSLHVYILNSQQEHSKNGH